MFQRKPTKVQALMIGLMAAVFVFLLLWLVPELVGVFDPAREDTFSEWVWDLSFGPVLFISVLFFLTGGVFVWAAGHFIEGYRRRRRIEEQMDRIKGWYDAEEFDPEEEG